MFNSIQKISGDRLSKIYISSLFTGLEAFAAALPYGIVYFVIMDLIRGNPFNNIIWKISLILAMLFFRYGFALKSQGGMMSASYEVTGRIRIRMGEHLRQLPMSFFAGRDLGRLSNYLLQDTKLIDFTFSHILVRAVYAGFFTIVISIILIMIEWQLLLPLLLVVPFALPLFFIGQNSVKKIGGMRLDIIDRADSAVLEYVQGIQVMKSHDMVGKKNRKLHVLFKELLKQSLKLEGVSFASAISFAVIMEIGYVLLIFYGGYLIAQNKLDPLVFLLFLVIALRLYAPIFELYKCSSLLRYMRNAGERVEEVIREEPQSYHPENHPIRNFDILFSGVGFRYDKRSTLDDINLTIPNGKMTALVGPSGSGKTTIMNLITRLWEIQDGTIEVGGVDISAISPERLLSHISIVFQDVYLFNDTVRNNIAIGKSNPSNKEIVRAAKAAQCHQFISELPMGYDTVIGEGGKSLSGGEKQRISIARAILKDAPIILLDEATASLDPENEACIQKAIDNLLQTKTVVVIAHRLNTIAGADQIVVMDRGKIVQRGTHDSLIKIEGLYRRLWKEQQRVQGWKLKRKGNNPS